MTLKEPHESLTLFPGPIQHLKHDRTGGSTADMTFHGKQSWLLAEKSSEDLQL